MRSYMKSSVLTKSWPIETYLWCIRGVFYWKESYLNLFRKAKTLCLFSNFRFSLILVLYDLLVTTYLEELHYLPKYCDGGWGGWPKSSFRETQMNFLANPILPNLSLTGDGGIYLTESPKRKCPWTYSTQNKVELLSVVKMLIKR